MYSHDNKRLAELHQQQFYEYITSGRLYKLRLLLEDESGDVDVNRVDENGLTPLVLACALDDERTKTRNQLLRLLLDNGADLNVPDQRGASVFSWACKTGKTNIVKLFIKKSAVDIDFNASDFAGDTPLMHAVRAQNASLVRILVKTMRKMDVNIDKRNHSDVTPYLEAKRIGNEEIVSILKNEGNASDSIQICPLFSRELSPLMNENIEINSSTRPVRPTLASKMRQTLSLRNRKEWIEYKRSWNNDHHDVNRIDLKNNKNSSSEVRKMGLANRLMAKCSVSKSMLNEVQKKGPRVQEYAREGDNSNDNKATVRAVGDGTGDQNSVSITGRTSDKSVNEHKMKDKDIKDDRISSSLRKKGSTVGSSVADSFFQRNQSRTDKRDEEEIEKSTDKFFESRRAVRPLIAVNVSDEERLEDDVFSDEDVDKMSQNMGPKQLPKRSSLRKKSSVNDAQDRLSLDKTSDNEQNTNRNASLGGLISKLIQDKPASQWLRASSYLSLSAGEDVTSRSRSNSGTSSRRVSLTVRRPSSAAAAITTPKSKISYEDIYQLCPEMKQSGQRQWYSDLQWMLALKAHQCNSTYLPAQPQRPACEETPSSEMKLEIENRPRRRPSVIGDIKRPGLQKRHTTLMSFKGTQT